MKKNFFPIAIFFMATLTSISTMAQVKSRVWTIKKTEWAQSDEKNFQDFVKIFGQAREKKLCLTTEACIKNKVANPYYFAKNPVDLKIFADCADLPHILRGYFAFMNDLPFSYPSDVSKVDPKDTKPDIRYSLGNRIWKVTKIESGADINKVLVNVANFISSAAFRVHPARDVETNGAYVDFYSPALRRDLIVPGTVVYDPNGHVLVVYEVSEDGRIKMIDAHPDNSLTQQIYGDKFIRDTPAKGSGFKAWRPVKLVNAKADTNGTFYGGTIQVPKNSEILNYNLEQYIGQKGTGANGWAQGKFFINDIATPYYEYVRRVLAQNNLKYEPVKEISDMLDALCNDLQDRKKSVDDAISKGIHKLAHPIKLPENIYGTTGEWESYSTPSRDARFKAAVREARNMAQKMVERYRNGDPLISYSGGDLGGDLRRIYDAKAYTCNISYTKSNGSSVFINLDDAINRIYDLSFDPYHSPELRWGEKSGAASDAGDKMNWYNAEKSLRNSIERNYDIRMDKTVSELPSSGLGTANAQNISIKNYLNSI